jgi:hypothetical protein
VGDPIEVNPFSPTYASLTGVATLAAGQNNAPDRTGQLVVATLDKSGKVGQESFAKLTTNVQYIAATGHNIPDVFWQYLTNSRGLVMDAGSGETTKLTEGDVVDWTYSVGLPLTEAYWVKARVGGIERDVLVQAFERRVLTYTPANSVAYQVEMGNVGRHYYTWRYLTGQAIPALPQP